jgi:bifunctional DNA-binding transcriptional regulator/antitoxin component of YhaV-PrlF toxin-antitoxin module
MQLLVARRMAIPPFSNPRGIADGMKVKMDKAGRIVVPKLLRERQGFKANMELDATEQLEGVLLRRVEQWPALVKVDGLWVHQGAAEPEAALGHVLEKVREERIASLTRT